MRLEGQKSAAPKHWVWIRDVRSLAEALCGQGLAAACSPRSSTGQGPSGQCLLDMVVRVVLPRWAPPALGSFWILLKVSCERTLSRGSRTVRFLPGLLRCPEGSEHGAGMKGPAADGVQGLSLVHSCLTWRSSLRCGTKGPAVLSCRQGLCSYLPAAWLSSCTSPEGPVAVPSAVDKASARMARGAAHGHWSSLHPL